MRHSKVTRRDFISVAMAALAGTSIGAEIQPKPLGVSLHQEPLAFPFEALEPYLNAANLRRHYEEHHAHYVSELQAALAAEEMVVGNVTSLMPGMSRMVQPQKANARMPLGQLMSQGLSYQAPQTLSQESIKIIRSAGGGHINHTAFWRFLCPPETGPSGPQGKVARAIQEDFGSIKAFRQVFKEKALDCRNSGWAWLVYRPDGCLVATSTANEDNPLMKDHVPWHEAGRPILALDLWEHSYYEQYQEDRERYIDAWWKLVNWDYVGRTYGLVSARG